MWHAQSSFLPDSHLTLACAEQLIVRVDLYEVLARTLKYTTRRAAVPVAPDRAVACSSAFATEGLLNHLSATPQVARLGIRHIQPDEQAPLTLPGHALLALAARTTHLDNHLILTEKESLRKIVRAPAAKQKVRELEEKSDAR